MKKFLLSLVIFTTITACKTQYPELEDGLYADIKTNKGSIVLKLAHDKAPITVANFVSLIEGNNPKVSDEFKGKKFYNGISFHRVIADFMIQGGDPSGTGSGGPGYRFDDEFSDLIHDGPGVLSMANAGPGTNGSQFFITHKETPWLDGKHSVFGKVVIGQNVVDSIQQNDKIDEVIIIRKGSVARKFDAPKIFEDYFKQKEELEMSKVERQKEIIESNQQQFEDQKIKSTTTASGLQYLITTSGQGTPVSKTNACQVHYAVYFADGTLLETSKLEIAEENDMVNFQRKEEGQYLPIPARVGPEDRMIEGFKEGLRLLREGDHATLFLPYTLAYGEQGVQGIPPQSDLIFMVEIVSVEEPN